MDPGSSPGVTFICHTGLDPVSIPPFLNTTNEPFIATRRVCLRAQGFALGVGGLGGGEPAGAFVVGSAVPAGDWVVDMIASPKGR